MALTYRFYRSPVVGDGTSPRTAFRSKLADIIVGAPDGTAFWDLLHDARPVRYALAYCDESVHAQIAGDAAITALSPEFADEAAMQAWLDGAEGGQSDATYEGDGISVAWRAAQSTRRDMWRYLIRQHVLIQDCRRIKDPDAMDFFARALTLRVNQIPANTRTRIQAWMTNKGLDTGWITGNTTVRQVLQFILQNIDWPLLPLGPHAI